MNYPITELGENKIPAFELVVDGKPVFVTIIVEKFEIAKDPDSGHSYRFVSAYAQEVDADGVEIPESRGTSRGDTLKGERIVRMGQEAFEEQDLHVSQMAIESFLTDREIYKGDETDLNLVKTILDRKNKQTIQ